MPFIRITSEIDINPLLASKLLQHALHNMEASPEIVNVSGMKPGNLVQTSARIVN